MNFTKRIFYIILFLMIGAVLFWGIKIPMDGHKFSSKKSPLFILYFRNDIVADFPILTPLSKPNYELHSSSSQFAQAWEVQYQSKSDKSTLLSNFSKYLGKNDCNIINPHELGCNWKSIDSSAYVDIEVIKGHTSSRLFELRILSTKEFSSVDFLMVE